MLFQTDIFFKFFLTILALIMLVRTRSLQVLILVIASYVFYMSWNWAFFGLLLASTVLDYVAAQLIEASATHRVRRAWVVASLVGNLGLLGFFKYYNFFLSTLEPLLGTFIPHVNVVLPVGISFYSFEAISYTLDVYWGRRRAERNFLDYALFISFFPHLVAGPIVRSVDFLPQIKRPLIVLPEQVRRGFNLFLVGLVKKIAIADNVAPLVNQLFAHPQGLPSVLVVLGTFAFGVQIYCDFSGYTDMARGCARIMGIELCLNFTYPYFARSFSEFWRRWHMSLSSWLRDYLYIPLGGNRRGEARSYVNLMATMALGGLWHGAATNFIVWGVFHGGLLCVGRGLSQLTRGSALWARLSTWAPVVVFQWLVVQYCVFLGWLIFRVGNAPDLFYCVRKYVLFDGSFSVARLGVGNARPFMAVAALGAFAVLHTLSWATGGFASRLERWSLWRCVPIYIVTFFVLTLVWPSDVEPFIYFQF